MLCFKSTTKCWVLKIPTVPRYWIKLTGIFKKTCLPSQQKMVKSSCTDKGTASINGDPRSKQANLPKHLATKLAQTRVQNNIT